ncbi:MAG: hypothetical protein AAFY01_05810 [Pseudomonadota bacterium]
MTWLISLAVFVIGSLLTLGSIEGWPELAAVLIQMSVLGMVYAGLGFSVSANQLLVGRWFVLITFLITPFFLLSWVLVPHEFDLVWRICTAVGWVLQGVGVWFAYASESTVWLSARKS